VPTGQTGGTDRSAPDSQPKTHYNKYLHHASTKSLR